VKENKKEECNKACRSKIARWVLLSVLLSTLLTGCSAMQGIGSALSLAGGSAPSVEATAQVGKENNTEGDAVVSNRRVEDSSLDVKDTGVSNVKQVKSGVSSEGWNAEAISVQNVPALFLFLFALGWVLPGPIDILRGVGKSLLFLRDFVTMRI
jgi:predicted small secreted protein